MSIAEQVKEAGVVGAGGAGFPTHVKAASKADTVIANGAECEPLLHKDGELMAREAAQVVRGLQLLMESTGARRGIIGIKEKNRQAVAAMEAAVAGTDVEIHPLGAYYPTGDEYILVYETTGRLIPPLGIPLEVGVVVNNVETLYNLAAAVEGQPVTTKVLTVNGAVRQPVTVRVPLGVSFREVVELAGGATVDRVGMFVGGIMMGPLVFDLEAPVTKTTTGLVVLPAEHPLVERMSRPERARLRIGKSACDQCSYCTEFCPRYLLGYAVQPHKVMRNLGFTVLESELWTQWGQLCCECGLCSLYSCPEDLYPKEACVKSKRDWQEAGREWSGLREVTPHPLYASRRVPVQRLIRRLGVAEYDRPAPWLEATVQPERVCLPLQQHLGAPAEPTVRVGERVQVGQKIAVVPEGALGAPLHASIDGLVTQIDEAVVIERKA
ncbi:MAG TPA: NADH dehydrogenase subunit [Armatimonadetes bacterium]|nr:NADH dehydrogenase subunit [Armatimonadota bacterium]